MYSTCIKSLFFSAFDNIDVEWSQKIIIVICNKIRHEMTCFGFRINKFNGFGNLKYVVKYVGKNIANSN